ncbi:MAG: ribose operon transcriptional repressor RbsR [Rhodospirillales bacterium]
MARAAGVSVTTVSHVFNQTRPVAEETQRRVRATIEQLGYQPSVLARALRGEKTGSIGMLVTSSTNPVFAEVIKGVEQRCFERGYSLILCNTGDDRERLNRHLKTLLQKRIDGLVVMTTNADLRFFDDLREHRGLMMVAIDAEDLEEVPVVKDDSTRGGALAADYLLGRGFRKLAAIAGPAAHPRAEQRLQGFVQALREAGQDEAALFIVRSDMTLADGAAAMRRLLHQAERRPDAVFCMNDLSAIGALHAAREAGLAVPDDISLIGYDDIEMAAYCAPPLTTVRQPTLDIGRTAADRLIGLVEGAESGSAVVALPPELIERQSVGFGPAYREPAQGEASP